MIENSAVAGLHEQGSVESDAFRELRPEVSIYIYILQYTKYIAIVSSIQQ